MKTKQFTIITKEDLINRDESDKIIVKYSKEADSPFQRLRKAIQAREINVKEVKKYYSIENETFKLLFV